MLCKRIGLGLLMAVGIVLFINPCVQAQEKFPTKPVKMVITHGAGGSLDISSRATAQYMQKYLGVPVVCENMEGAGGRRAMEYVFNQAKPDGYTIVASMFPSRVIGELMYPMKYKMKDFVHLASWLGGNYRSVIVVKDSPFKTFKDIVEESKKRKLTCSISGGMGSTSHLQGVFLKEICKINMEIVPYDSGAEALASVLGKHTDFSATSVSSSAEVVRSDQARMLAIHSTKRIKEFPDVPSLKELGYTGVECGDGSGAWAPPKTPKDRAMILASAIIKATQNPDYLKWADKAAMLLDPLGPEEFYKSTLDDYENITKVLPLLKADQGKK